MEKRSGPTLVHMGAIALAAAAAASAVTYFVLQREIARTRKQSDLALVEELTPLRSQAIFDDLQRHVHADLENGVRECAPPGRDPTALVKKLGPDKCTVTIQLEPVDGGSCPIELDVYVKGHRSPARVQSAGPSGGVVVSSEFPCARIEELSYVGVARPQ